MLELKSEVQGPHQYCTKKKKKQTKREKSTKQLLPLQKGTFLGGKHIEEVFILMQGYCVFSPRAGVQSHLLLARLKSGASL